MGKLLYNGSLNSDIDDRTLAHLQVVIGIKLRRGESFYFSWRDDSSVGDGRTVIWLNQTIPLVFKFSGGKMPALNRHWIEQLSEAADSAGGLQVVPEPDRADLRGGSGSRVHS